MSPEERYQRVREATELAGVVLDWIVNPTSDAPPGILVSQLIDDLEDLERDLLSDLLAEEAAA